MKAATERKIIRWFHILASIPVIGLIYGPVGEFPQAVNTIRWVIFPLIVLTGFGFGWVQELRNGIDSAFGALRIILANIPGHSSLNALSCPQ
jgi:hypothetical protein